MLSFADVGITSNHEGGGDEQYSAAQHEAMCGDRKRRWRSLLVGVDDGCWLLLLLLRCCPT